MILGALRSLILSKVAVQGLIENRLTPGYIPQGSALPAADMRIVSTKGSNTLGGYSSFRISNVTIDCYSTDALTADRICQAILGSGDDDITKFRGKREGVNILGIDVVSDISQDIDGVDPASDKHRLVSSITLRVSWAEDCK